jgi:hypothetical protein
VSASDSDGAGWWAHAIRAIPDTGESYDVPPQAYADGAFVAAAGRRSAGALGIAAGTLAGVLVILLASRRVPRLVYVVAVAAVLEVVIFARSSLATFHPSGELQSVIKAHIPSGDERVSLGLWANQAMIIGAHDIWGYDPGVPKRYAELLTWLEGGDPNRASQYIRLSGQHRLYDMLRLRTVLVPRPEGTVIVGHRSRPMKRFQLIRDYLVCEGRDAVLAAMGQAAFDPRQTVILETEPTPAVAVRDGDGGSVVVLDSSTDHVTLQVDLPGPAILLITDSYSCGWRAWPVGPSAQERYHVLPANWALQAIPLASGRHRLRLEYRPTAFVVGGWISIAATVSYLAAVGLAVRRARQVRIGGGDEPSHGCARPAGAGAYRSSRDTRPRPRGRPR